MDIAQRRYGAELRWRRKYLWRKRIFFTDKMKRKRIMKCWFWNVALYPAETWTLSETEEDSKRLKCAEWKSSAGLKKLQGQ